MTLPLQDTARPLRQRTGPSRLRDVALGLWSGIGGSGDTFLVSPRHDPTSEVRGMPR